MYVLSRVLHVYEYIKIHKIKQWRWFHAEEVLRKEVKLCITWMKSSYLLSYLWSKANEKYEAYIAWHKSANHAELQL